MTETIQKFQPDRTLYLRGVDGRGAMAALYDATPTSFTVSGVFRDPSDFAVLVIYDADDFYSHPSFKPLPDFSLKGMVLEFEMQTSGLQNIDSPKFPTIDWPYLDVIASDGTVTQIELLKYATPSVPLTAATGQFGFTFASDTTSDYLRLWFENVAFTYEGGATTDTEDIAAWMANAINTEDWALVGGSYALSATSAGGVLTVSADPAGVDGNMIRMYAVSSNPGHLDVTANPVHFSGGSSDVTWHVKLDFTALGIDSVRQMWLTFAPQLVDSAAYGDTNWDAVFTNWGITADPNNLSALQVAGPGSVRIEESDAWCNYSGDSWALTDVGWFSKGFANVANVVGDSVTIAYWCQFEHDLWLGTSLYTDRGIFNVTIDGVAASGADAFLASDTTSTAFAGNSIQPASSLDTYVDTGDPISTRRQLASGITRGQHAVTLTVAAASPSSSGNYCYFDFLEAVVSSDVPAAPGPWPDRSPAIDYDTNHGYQLSPARLLWMFDQLGFTGPMNEYIGVFWWNQRTNPTQRLAFLRVEFSGTFAATDQIFLDISGTTIGKTVFASENNSIFAAHFAYFINQTFAGIWAEASGNMLTITARSAAPDYQFTFSAYATTSTGGTVTWSGDLNASSAGTWIVDPSQSPCLNYGAVCWHQDLYAQVKARDNTIVSAFSMELVDTPDDPPGQVWVARFPDNTPVLTSTGFGTLNSAQCIPMAPEFLAYQQQAYLHVAQLQAAAGLRPEMQFGEFLWWFFPNGGPLAAGSGGMAYYDEVTNAAAQAALGRPLYAFTRPTNDPSVNNYADANFLAQRLNQHLVSIAAFVHAMYPDAIFEILFPNDVNGSTVTPLSQVGGQLNAYVSFPVEWKSQAAAPFQRFKLEQLAFGTSDRNLNLVVAGLKEIVALAWPISNLRYLYPIDNPGVPQWTEYALAQAAGFPYFTPFAMDHVCLMNWPVEAPAVQDSAQQF